MFLIAVGVWMQVAAAQPASHTPPPPGTATVQAKIQPETVTVGEHFTVTLTVHAPAGSDSSIKFPAGPDTSSNAGLVAAFAPMQRHDTTQGGYVDAAAVYSLTAWHPGKVEMALDDVMVANAHLKLANDSVMVRSVLPKDSAARAKAHPKPPRELLPLPPLYKRLLQEHRQSFLLGIILAILALVALIIWLLVRKRNEAAAAVSWEWVEKEFQRIEAMHLLDRGETELHAILMTKVVREYLIEKFPSIRASATTRELVSALKNETLIPAEQTLALFERVDLLKFAHDQIKKDDASTVGAESRAVVHEIEAREEAARVAAALVAERAAAATAAKGSSKRGNKPAGRKAA